MPKRHRDALTGQYTTADDAAARPAETVAETVERLNAMTADALLGALSVAQAKLDAIRAILDADA